MAHINGQIAASALTPLSVGGHLLSAPAAAFEEWRRQAAKAGRVLTITSTADAYRVLAVQERVFLQRYIRQATGGGIYGDVRWYRGVRYVRRHGAAAAVPGTSNHGRGLAVDVKNAGPFGGAFHDWMLTTGPALGWTNTEGRSVGEPWHWVHDGVTLASSATDSTAGLKPAPPITIPTIPQEEDDMFTDADRKLLERTLIAAQTANQAADIATNAANRAAEYADVAGKKVDATRGDVGTVANEVRHVARAIGHPIPGV